MDGGAGGKEFIPHQLKFNPIIEPPTEADNSSSPSSISSSVYVSVRTCQSGHGAEEENAAGDADAAGSRKQEQVEEDDEEFNSFG